MKISLPALGLLFSLSPLDASVLLLKYDFEDSTLYAPFVTVATDLAPTHSDPSVLTGGDLATDATTTNNNSTRLRRVYPVGLYVPVWGAATATFRVQSGRTDLESAVANDSFFTITLNPHEVLSLSTLYFDTATANINYAHGLAVRSSLTGSTNLFNETISGTPGEPQAVSVDLTAHEEFQDISDPVTFTFYLWNVENSNNVLFYIDNISFYAVPEPGSTALFGLGAASLLLKRRRKS